MTAFPWDVAALALVLALNRLATPATYFRPVAFWAIQGLDLALAVAAAVWGLPGLAGYSSVGWLVAALLAFHVFQNVALRSRAVHKRAMDEAERERIRRIRALEAQSDAPAEP